MYRALALARSRCLSGCRALAIVLSLSISLSRSVFRSVRECGHTVVAVSLNPSARWASRVSLGQSWKITRPNLHHIRPKVNYARSCSLSLALSFCIYQSLSISPSLLLALTVSLALSVPPLLALSLAPYGNVVILLLLLASTLPRERSCALSRSRSLSLYPGMWSYCCKQPEP